MRAIDVGSRAWPAPTPEIMSSFDRPADPRVPPSPWVVRWAALIRAGGPVLDLACGHGRHARFFLDRLHPVTAVDIDVSGVEDLRGRGAEVLGLDLETGDHPLQGRRFAGVVVTNYLHRPHFAWLPEVLDENGVLIFETFARGNERFGRPRNPAFLLAPGELLDAFSDRLRIVAYEHGLEREPRLAVRQRLCAVKGSAPVTL